MADHTLALGAGAAQFRELLARIDQIAGAAFVGPEIDDDAGDLRDYVAMSIAVSHSIRANLAHANRAHREGYLRALTSLLCIVAEGFAPGPRWEPLDETAASFEAPALAAALLARVAR